MNLDQMEIATRICADLQNSGIGCGLRGSLLAGTADQYSDIDLRIDTQAIPLTLIDQIISVISPLVGDAIDIRFDDDQKEVIFLTLHAYALPIFWRIDIEIHGTAPSSLRETLKKKYPWQTEWHQISKRAYEFKQAARGWKDQKFNRET